jgi:hypothetical protein
VPDVDGLEKNRLLGDAGGRKACIDREGSWCVVPLASILLNSSTTSRHNGRVLSRRQRRSNRSDTRPPVEPGPASRPPGFNLIRPTSPRRTSSEKPDRDSVARIPRRDAPCETRGKTRNTGIANSTITHWYQYRIPDDWSEVWHLMNAPTGSYSVIDCRAGMVLSWMFPGTDQARSDDSFTSSVINVGTAITR